MIRGITFSEQSFYSADFAHFQNFFLNGNSGITQGCQITHDDTTVTIGTGRFIVHGRMMNIEEAEVVRASHGFSSGYNCIVYEIDLSKENTITEFRQGYIRVLNTDELIQEDLNNGGSVYQYPFCHFQWSGATITDLTIDAATMVLPNIFGDVAANWEIINKQFDEWFLRQKKDSEAWVQSQKSTVEGIIADLQGKGFENASVYVTATMVARNWNTSLATYSFEAVYPHGTYNIFVEPSSTCTKDQYEAWCFAGIVGSADSNMVKAFGDVPVVDIPVIIRIVRSADAPQDQVMQIGNNGDADYQVEIEGTDYSIENAVNNDSELKENKYSFDIL